MYGATVSSSQTLLVIEDVGIGLGAHGGWRMITGSGFTLSLQAGPRFVYSTFSGRGYARAYANVNIGWSF